MLSEIEPTIGIMLAFQHPLSWITECLGFADRAGANKGFSGSRPADVGTGDADRRNSRINQLIAGCQPVSTGNCGGDNNPAVGGLDLASRCSAVADRPSDGEESRRSNGLAARPDEESPRSGNRAVGIIATCASGTARKLGRGEYRPNLAATLTRPQGRWEMESAGRVTRATPNC